MNIAAVRTELAQLVASHTGHICSAYLPSGGIEGPVHLFLTLGPGQPATMGRRIREITFFLVAAAVDTGGPGDAERLLDPLLSDGDQSLEAALMDIDTTAAGTIDDVAVSEHSGLIRVDTGSGAAYGVQWTVEVVAEGVED